MIGGPVPQRVGRPVLRTLILVGLPLALVAALVLAIVPGPTAPGLYSQVVTVHDSMHPQRLDAQPPTEAPVPQLQTSLSSQLDGPRIESWLYLYDRSRVTVHRIPDRPDPPRNATAITVGELDVSLFELRDLSFLVWAYPGGATIVAVGSCPVHELKQVVAWVDANGPGPDVAPASDSR